VSSRDFLRAIRSFGRKPEKEDVARSINPVSIAALGTSAIVNLTRLNNECLSVTGNKVYNAIICLRIARHK